MPGANRGGRDGEGEGDPAGVRPRVPEATPSAFGTTASSC